MSLTIKSMTRFEDWECQCGANVKANASHGIEHGCHTPYPKLDQEQHTILLQLTEGEYHAIKEIEALHGIPPTRILIKGLRMYQAWALGFAEFKMKDDFSPGCGIIE